MEITLHNTRTRQKETFTPLGKEVGMYVCGPTVYDRAHLGNARPVIVFDVLNRLLRTVYPVKYVRNITDIDDKIILRSLETGESIESLTKRTTSLYQTDMAALGNLPPDAQPKATDHIPEMISIIAKLMDNGNAYQSEGHVLFSIASNARHGSLTGIDLQSLRAGARVEQAAYKQAPEDFVLWKPSPAGWPSWNSLWGAGRPGWHIECSAMSQKYLGTTFDIHGGGQDLAFPHHECENAQTTCANKTETMANFWLHNGMLMVNGKKMSKSLGNFLTVADILKHGSWAGEAFRLLVLKTHYRSPMDYTWGGLMDAKRELDGFYRKLSVGFNDWVTDEFETALCDDLNTPLALTMMHAERDPKMLFMMGLTLGLFQKNPDEWFQGEGIDESIAKLIADRSKARKEKRWSDADAIRIELTALGIILEDGPNGTTWHRV